MLCGKSSGLKSLHKELTLLVVLASLVFTMADCTSRGHGSSGDTDLVRKYESWLRTQSPKLNPAVGEPKRSEQVVFITDLRATPELGLSKVYLKNGPENIYYVYGDQTNRLISPAFYDGLAAVVVPIGRWGYIEESGRFVFAPVFRKANDFDTGIATALVGPTAGNQFPAPDGTWVLLNKTGSIKPLDRSIKSISDFFGDLAAFSTGEKFSGYIDRTGAVRIGASFGVARPFCADGAAPVRTIGGWGLIDEHGKFVIPPEYDDIHCFSEGMAAAKRGKWGFIDNTGKFVVPPQFYGVGDFSEGLAIFESRIWPNGPQFIYISSYGFVDRSGSVAVPAKYAWAYPFKFDIAKVGTKRTNWLTYPISYFLPADPYYTEWSYIDRRGAAVEHR